MRRRHITDMVCVICLLAGVHRFSVGRFHRRAPFLSLKPYDMHLTPASRFTALLSQSHPIRSYNGQCPSRPFHCQHQWPQIAHPCAEEQMPELLFTGSGSKHADLVRLRKMNELPMGGDFTSIFDPGGFSAA